MNLIKPARLMCWVFYPDYGLFDLDCDNILFGGQTFQQLGTLLLMGMPAGNDRQ